MRYLLMAALAFVSTLSNAAINPTFVGSISSYERFDGTQWVSLPLTDPSFELVTAPISSDMLTKTCGPAANSCGNWIHGNEGLLRSTFTFADMSISPDALPCSVGYYCAESDPYIIQRTPTAHTASFADQMYNERDGLVQFVRLFWDISGDNWIPDGAIGFGSLYNLHDVTGSGSFSYEYMRDSVILEGSIRGTFDITMGYAPAPGTLALFALGAVGAVGMTLRRRRRH